MFFANTLGPALNESSGVAMLAYVRQKLGNRSTVSAEELRQLVAEFLTARANPTKPDEAIQYLARKGRLSAQDARTYKIAA